MRSKKHTKNITIDDLAMMIAKGFESQDQRFEQVDQRFERVDKRFEQVEQRLDQVDVNLAHIDAKLDRLEKEVQYINDELVRKDEFDDLMGRVKYLEMKLGIESGK